MKIYLDLLPQEKKSELRRKKIFRLILRDQFLFLLPVILFIIILFNINYLLNLQYETISKVGNINKSKDNYQELSKYEEAFKKGNETIDLLTKIQNNHLYWTNAFISLENAAIDGIQITDISNKNYQIFLLGKAKTRDILLNFRTELEKSNCFQNINVPLSNLVVKEDVDFQLDLEIKKECLRKQ